MTYLDTDGALIRSMLSAEVSPPSDADDLFVLYALLMRAKGSEVTPEDVHDAWSVWMRARDPRHPSLVPFRELSVETQASDEPYAKAIRLAAAHRKARPGRQDHSRAGG
jgi:hypothetical protein